MKISRDQVIHIADFPMVKSKSFCTRSLGIINPAR